MAYQYVTLVSAGGTPVRISDQSGTPYPTTGTGALVFANGATITNPIIDNPTYIGPFVIDGDWEVDGDLILDGSSSGSTRVRASATANGTFVLPSIAGTDVLTANATAQTLTNKSISGASNTLTAIPNSALVNNTITVNGVSIALGSSGTITAVAADVQVGTTTVSSGTSGYVLYNNAGVLGNLATTGGGAVVRATGPVLSAPEFSSIVNTGTLTLPTLTDTLVGRATTDTLTNKTISGADNTLSNIGNSSLSNSSITINGSSVSLGGSVTVTAAASSITVGTTTVGSGTDTYILYNNAGTLGNVATSGSGNVALTTSPVFTTPSIGAATGTSVSLTDAATIYNATAIPAGGTAGTGYRFSSTANFGVFFGSGAPTLSAAQGSLYVRSDGAPYYNNNGSTGWTQIGTSTAVGSSSLSAFLAADTTIAVANTFTNGPNTGSIGANGEIWLITVFATYANSSGGTMTASIDIWDGSATLAQGASSMTTGFNTILTCSAVVTLSAATTFTLRCTDNVGGNLGAMKTMANNKGTGISAVRLA